MNNFTIIVLFRALAALSQLGFVIALIKYVDFETTGNYYLQASLAYIGTALVFIGADSYIQKAIIEKYPKNANIQIFEKKIWIFCIFGGGISSISSAIFSLLSGYSLESFQLNLLCGFLSIGMFLASVTRNIFFCIDRIKVGVFITFLENFVKMGSAFFFIGYLNYLKVEALLLSTILGSFSAFILSGFFYKKNNLNLINKRHEEKINFSVIFKRFAPSSIGAFLNLFQMQGYRFIVGGVFSDMQSVGIFSTLGNLGLTGASIITGLYAQWKMRKAYLSDHKELLAILINAIILVILLSVVSIFISKLFFELLHKKELIKYLFIIPLCVLAEGCNLVISLISFYVNKNKDSLWSGVLAGLVGSIITLLLLFTLIKFFLCEPLVSIGVSLLIGQFTTTAVFYYATISKKYE